MVNIILILFNLLENKYRRLKNFLELRHIKSIGKNCSIEYPAKFIGTKNIVIGNDFSSKAGLKLRAFNSFNNQTFNPSIRLGNNIHIENNCHISCINYIEIKDNVLIASNVFISDHKHGLEDYSDLKVEPFKRNLTSKGSIVIGESVWIGENTIILAGVEIGSYSVIAANAVVNKSIPAFSVAAGVPAKVIKQLK